MEEYNEYYIIKVKKRLVSRVIRFGAVLLLISLAFIVLHSYRYERFKDGHMYMRYDKWFDEYERWDIPTKEWVELN